MENNCPGCGKAISNKTLNTNHLGVIGVHECPKCKAVFGQCYKGDSYKIVKPYMSTENVPFENCFYYDLVTLGSAGIDRIHGWADKATRLIVQVG